MEIVKKAEDGKLTVSVTGRLETTTAPLLDAEVRAIGTDVMELVLDFSKLEYVSSAGLRVILAAQKAMSARKGSLKLAGVNSAVKKVLDITGFSPLLTFA